MGAIPYNLGQADTITIGMPHPLVTIAGDNPTGFYLHFPGLAPGQQWVFPYTYGFCFPLPAPAGSVNVTSRDTPVGFPAAPTDTNLASLVAYDYPLPYSPGIRLALGSGWTQVGSKTLAAGADSLVTQIAPATSKTMAIIIEGTGANVANLQVQGQTTGTIYLPTMSSNPRGMQIFPILGQVDTQYSITVGTGNSNPIAVFVSDEQASTIGQGNTTMARSMPVTIAFDQTSVPITISNAATAAGWLFPQSYLGWNSFATVNVGGTQLVAAIGNQRIYLHKMWLYLEASQPIILWDGTTGGTAVWKSNTGQGPFAVDFGGVPLTLGNALTIQPGANVNIDGGLYYSQA